MRTEAKGKGSSQRKERKKKNCLSLRREENEITEDGKREREEESKGKDGYPVRKKRKQDSKLGDIRGRGKVKDVVGET